MYSDACSDIDIIVSLEDTQNLAPRDVLHLGNPVKFAKNHTNLWWRQTFLGELADVLLNLQKQKKLHEWMQVNSETKRLKQNNESKFYALFKRAEKETAFVQNK